MIYNMKLTAEDLNLIGLYLGKGPFEQVSRLIQNLQQQATAQERAEATAAAVLAEAKKKQEAEANEAPTSEALAEPAAAA